jgi:hypothetical protein
MTVWTKRRKKGKMKEERKNARRQDMKRINSKCFAPYDVLMLLPSQLTAKPYLTS